MTFMLLITGIWRVWGRGGGGGRRVSLFCRRFSRAMFRWLEPLSISIKSSPFMHSKKVKYCKWQWIYIDLNKQTRKGDQWQLLANTPLLSVTWSTSWTSPLPRGHWLTNLHQSASFVSRSQVPLMKAILRPCSMTRPESPYFQRTLSTLLRRKIWIFIGEEQFQTIGDVIKVGETLNILIA